MKKYLLYFVLLILVPSCKGEEPDSGNIQDDNIRQPVFAGQFYAADSAKLVKQIIIFLENSKPVTIDEAVAIIVPHAGYIYSGQIAADAYNQVRQNKYDLIVVLGTNHTTAGFSKISVYPKGKFATPIGAVEIDDTAADQLMKADEDVTANLTVHEKEHSVEVQIPFIKYLFSQAKILPIIVGEPDIEMCTRFGKSLASVIKDKKTLIVASSDLSHYPNFNDAVKVDNKTLKTIAGLNPEEIVSVMQDQMYQHVPQLATCACGEAPIVASVTIAKEMGANCASIISYSNSGYNSVGSTDRVVGYGAVVISKGKVQPTQDVDTLITDNSYTLNSLDKNTLLNYARRTLDQYFAAQILPLPRDMNSFLKMKRGAFVTLKKNGELRGCIGHMSEDTPLCTTIGAMALQAAFNDSRFSPLSQQELDQVEIEISVLTPFTKVKNADEIVLGRDGVIVKKESKQAVYLPQVATETGWNKATFLNQLCLKAGLKEGDWKQADLFTFQADVFSESEFH
jgi:hypothetical protein